MKKSMIIMIAAASAAAGLGVGIGVMAANTPKTISAELRPDFTIIIDGTERTFKNVDGDIVEPVLYDGTTYLPVRAIGELMGKTVIWNEDTKTVELRDNKQPTVTDADVIINNGGTQNPTQAPQQPTAAPTQPTAAPASGTTGSTTDIGAERAKEIALDKAGLRSASNIVFDKTETDMEHGIKVYEIEFRQGRTEYSAEINAATGEIVSWEVDYDHDHH